MPQERPFTRHALPVSYLLLVGVLIVLFVGSSSTFNLTKAFSDYGRLYLYSRAQSEYLSDEILLVNAADHPTDTLKAMLEKVWQHEPAVVMVDVFYDYADYADSLERSWRTIVLGAFEEDNSVEQRLSSNPFTMKEKHGMISFDNYFVVHKFNTNGDTIVPAIELAILEEFDPKLHSEIARTDGDIYVTYIPARNFMVLELEQIASLEVLPGEPDLIEGKIVIIGYLGIDGTYKPASLDWDVHQTPIGSMFGSFVIANRLHSLINNRMTSAGKPIEMVVSVIFLTASLTLVIRFRPKRRILYITIVDVCLVLVIFGLSILGLQLMINGIFFSLETATVALIFGTQAGIVYNISSNNGQSLRTA